MAEMPTLTSSGSPCQANTISAKSEGSSVVSIFGCFWDFGVNWGVNCCLAVLQLFVFSTVVFSERRFPKPQVAGSSRAGGARVLADAATSVLRSR